MSKRNPPQNPPIRNLRGIQLYASEYRTIVEIEDLIGEEVTLEAPECHVAGLHFEGGNLSTLPDSIGRLLWLCELSIVDSSLETIPEWFGNLRSLRSLHLSGNRLSVLPDSFGMLQNLTILYLDNNQLALLPESFAIYNPSPNCA